jgi:hypothetical protein
MDDNERRILKLERKLDIALSLIRSAKPYVQRHFDNSAVGFGKHANNLMNEMQEFINEVLTLRNEK